MGLEIVEFIMSVEEKFGIEIADRDAEKLTTVRKLIDYIMTKVKPGEDRGCMTQREIHRLRRALIIEQFGVTQFSDDSRFVQDMRIG